MKHVHRAPLSYEMKYSQPLFCIVLRMRIILMVLHKPEVKCLSAICHFAIHDTIYGNMSFLLIQNVKS